MDMKDSINLPEILTLPDVASYLEVDIQTVRSYINRDVKPLPVSRLSQNTVRVLKSQLIDWLESI